MSTWRDRDVGYTPIADFTRSMIKVLRLLAVKLVDFSMRILAGSLVLPFAYLGDYILGIFVAWYTPGEHENEKEISERIGRFYDRLLYLRDRMLSALEVVSHLPTGRAIRTLSNVELECIWLNNVVRISWPVGMRAAVERSTEEYINELLESHSLLAGVHLVSLRLGRSSPLIKSVKVLPLEGTGGYKLTTEIECSWISDDGEIMFTFIDITGRVRYLRLFNFRVSGLSKCTFESAMSAFFPWGRARAQFYERPSVRFEHESFLESSSGGDFQTAPLTSMMVDALVALLKTKLKEVALAPRSVSFNLTNTSGGEMSAGRSFR